MKVDLERLAEGYSHRQPSKALLARAARAISELQLGPASLVVDVGGGPGAHAAAFRASGARVSVVDPSPGMWERAGTSGAWVTGGRGESLPLRDDVADLVWFHLSLHHMKWIDAVTDAVRVCRPGGEVRIWTMGAAHFERSLMAQWFPSVPSIDAARFPDPDAVEDLLVDLGVSHVRHGVEVEKKRKPAGEWLAAVDGGFISTTQLIPPQEFAAGRARFLVSHPDPDEVLEYELRFDWVFGVV
ncbi:MAG: class I SAM-dependent methyltransferase [Acidimicrobiia bacterium]|nr:class I SAM-dependent methyltransferase [Acidimicrobiia bacterium]